MGIAGRQKSKRAKRAVVLGAVLFATLQLTFILFVEKWQPRIVDPEYGYRLERLRELRKQNPLSQSLVVLGSSRIGNGFESDYANEIGLTESNQRTQTVFNFSLTGGTAVWQYLVLQRLIHNHLKPDSVVVEILPASLLGDKQYFMDTYHFPTHRLRWSDTYTIKDLMPKQSQRHRSEWLWNNAVFPLHSHRFALLGLIAPKFQIEQNTPNSRPEVWRQILSPTGWIEFGVKEPTLAQRKEAEMLARNGYASSAGTLDVASETKETYCKILDCCREHNIRVQAVILMPESSEFRSWYSQAGLEKIEHFCQFLQKDFNVPIVDARTWIGDDKFWDGHHLLESGAHQFTARVYRESLSVDPPRELAMPRSPMRR